MKFNFLNWVLIALSVACGVAAAAPLPLTLAHEHALGLRTDFLKEQAGRLDLEQAMAAQKAGAFSPGTSPVMNFGIGSKPVWLHLAVDNTSASAVHKRLSIETAWLDSVELYIRHRDQTVARYRAGDTQPFGQRPVKNRFFVFDSTFEPGVSELYLRVETPDPMVVPIRLMSLEEAHARETLQEMSYGIVYGFLLALIAYNLTLYASLRSSRYLMYSLYLAMFMIANIAYTGHGFAWLWPESVRWQQWSNPVLMMLYAFSGLLFALRFLDIGEQFPRAHRGILGIGLAFGSAFAATLFLGSQLGALLIAFSFVSLFTFIMLALGVLSARSGNKPARYFLLASVAAMLGAVLTTLSTWGFIPHTNWTFRAVELGMLVDATLLALALSFQLRLLQEAKIRAEQLAHMDPLTGLNNRRAFYDIAEPLWSTAVRKRRDASVISIDIDNFKQINDTHGHEHGDDVLVAIADVLSRAIRQGDVLARWGGEEFIVFMPETSLLEATALAERLRTAIAGVRIRNPGGETTVTASLGVAQKEMGHATLDTLISSADNYLYQSKLQGRNRVSYELLVGVPVGA
ncbi:MAG: diguanylate cyclase [Thiobacillus sp.]